MTMFTDIALVAQVTVMGDKRAFDQLVCRHQSMVRRFFLNQTLGDDSLSDDLAQETFIKAYLNIGKFRGLSSFRTWLMRIAYHVFYDYCREHKRSVSDAHGEAVLNQTPAGSSGPSPLSAELKLDIYTALSQLKDDERTCIVLQLIDGYDIAGIAKITGMKTGTVKSHLSRGKEKLTNYLRNNGYGK